MVVIYRYFKNRITASSIFTFILAGFILGSCLSLDCFGNSEIGLPESTATVQVLRYGWKVRAGQSPSTKTGNPIWIFDEWANSNWLSLNKDIDTFWNKANFWSAKEDIYWMRYQLSTIKSKNLALFIFDCRFIREVYLGQTLVFKSNSNLNINQDWKIINLEPINEKNNVLSIKFKIPSKQDAHLVPPQIHLSTTKKLTNNLITNHLLDLIFGIIFSFMGLISMIVFLRNHRIKAFFYFGIFTGFYGFSNILTYGIFGLWIENPALYWGSFSMIWSIGMMGFFDEVISTKKRSLLWLAKWLHIIFCLISIPTAIYDFSFAMTIGFANTILLGFDIICFIVSVLPKALRGHRYARIISLGFAIVCASGAISLTTNIIIGGTVVFQYGMLIFVLTIIYLIEQMYIDARNNILDSKKELETKNLELERLDQLKDEFLANTSHEFKTPLHGIIGMAESLLTQDLSQENQNKHLNIIISNSRRLTHLVNDLLDTAKLKFQNTVLNKVPLNLWQVVESVIVLLKPLANKENIELLNQIDKDTKSVLADSDKLQQIFHNLIGNALKYSEKGTVVIFSNETEGFQKISIQDEGIGIAKEMQTKIFSAFVQGDTSNQRKFGGAGLGLSISQKLVEKHGGTISVESKPNVGSTFTFTLPSCDETAVDILNQEHLDSINIPPIDGFDLSETISNNIKSHTVLVVDDESLNLQIVCSQLMQQNIQIMNASSGLEALERVKSQKPDLVLLDIMMPEMDGFEVCKKLRETYSLSELPIIFLTAKNQIEDTLKGFQAGGNDYLTKPFSREELLARVKNQLQLLTTKDHIVALRNFSNSISEFQDSEQLLEIAFQYLNGEKYLKNAGLFYETKLIKSLNAENEKDLIDQFERLRPEKANVFVSNENRFFLLTTITGFEEYQILLESCLPFTDLDLEYTKSIIEQLNITRQNLYTLVNDSGLITVLALVAANLNKIEVIQSQDKYCSIITEKHSHFEKLHRIRLKTLKLYFPEEKLLQVHRSYLVNPQKVSGLRKKNRGRYDLYVGDEIVPVGTSFLNKIRTNLPNLRELN
jgi:signal transduction histidine kinase/DNA-binding LytR/AlgR family response regulator